MSRYLVYNRGKNRIYLTAEKSQFLWREYLKSQGITEEETRNPSSPHYRSPFTRDTKQLLKQEQDKWNYYEHRLMTMSENERLKFSTFLIWRGVKRGTIEGEIYDLLDSFCTFHKACYMAKKSSGGFYKPSSVDIYLPATFGDEFYFVVDHTTHFPFIGGKAGYLISVPHITKIEGTIDSFVISYKDGHSLQITQDSYKSSGAQVLVL